MAIRNSASDRESENHPEMTHYRILHRLEVELHYRQFTDDATTINS